MLWALFFLLFLHFRCISSKLVTTIIDDAFAGDAQSSISYSPLTAWGQGSASNHGRIAPDATQAQDGTWHDTTDDTTPDHDGTTPTFMEITFEGTGIDVRCIIANNETPSASIPAFTGTKANYSFFIDSVPQNQDYVHEAGTTGDVFLYNTSVFSTNTLSTGSHTLKLLLNGGPEVNGSVLLLFDYAIVTSDDGTSDEPGPSAVGTPGSVAPGSVAPGTTSAPTTTSTTSPSAKPSVFSSSLPPTTVGVTNSTTSPTFQSHGSTGSQSASPTQLKSANPSSSSSISLSSAHKSNLGAIVGGLVGGLTLVLLLLCFWLCRKRKRAHPLGIPRQLQFPYSLSHTTRRSLTPRKMDPIPPPSSSHDKPSINPPAPSASTSSSTTNVESRVAEDPAMRDYVRRLRAEVALLREQQQEMVTIQRIPSPEPPPRYEDV
ncbi:hypothetical protein MSAN_00413100 [Mycena sanguinolenta]|uniref:Uncharacterized protein n=1 Tax=Mycena sanguinolenta TaxID=230812 RepID=A0A8H7DH66_9AGAR|nr:hypothetical protein MSAN_00413100 [Mycena sanguinolenta]